MSLRRPSAAKWRSVAALCALLASSISAFAQTLLGIVMGLPVALIIGWLLKSRLYQVGAIDPLSLLVPAAALLLSAGVASLLPAIRAGSIQPIEALRAE